MFAPRELLFMTMDSSFTVVMARLRDGDQDAAFQVFGKFLNGLIALASSHFESRLQSKVDPEDVVQSVYLSFVKKLNHSSYELADWGGLWSLLATITVRKCCDRQKFWRASRRNVASEVASPHDSEGFSWWEAIDRGPTPLQALVLAETWDELIADKKPMQRTIAELAFNGYTSVEIAKQCRCSERTVYRAVKNLREQLIEIDSSGCDD
jgi:RNA polymerase sigma factor (sigma-70 family)